MRVCWGRLVDIKGIPLGTWGLPPNTLLIFQAPSMQPTSGLNYICSPNSSALPSPTWMNSLKNTTKKILRTAKARRLLLQISIFVSSILPCRICMELVGVWCQGKWIPTALFKYGLQCLPRLYNLAYISLMGTLSPLPDPLFTLCFTKNYSSVKHIMFMS